MNEASNNLKEVLNPPNVEEVLQWWSISLGNEWFRAVLLQVAVSSDELSWVSRMRVKSVEIKAMTPRVGPSVAILRVDVADAVVARSS